MAGPRCRRRDRGALAGGSERPGAGPVTPTFHPRLVNGRWGDPALFVEQLHERRALLFDLGDLAPLSARDLLRVSHAFVSHAHIDHLIGFDQLMRVHVGREKRITLVGPDGFAQRICHKLAGYTWDLVDRYDADLVFETRELGAGGSLAVSELRLSTAFALEATGERAAHDGVVAEEAGFAVRAAVLDHHGPCLGFVLEEPAHANVWPNRLAERGLVPGPWLNALKLAAVEGGPDDRLIVGPDGIARPLGELRDAVTVSPGQRLGYVSDVADTPDNRARIARLVKGADLLFIEARFRAAHAALAADRAHLTTTAAGEIARAGGVRRVEPFHFSPRYGVDEEADILAEVGRAFERADACGSGRLQQF